jgi:hypothetical protein
MRRVLRLDTHRLRRMVWAIIVPLGLLSTGAIASCALDDARPWRDYAIPISSLHVWNDSAETIFISSRPTGTDEWQRFDTYRISMAEGHLDRDSTAYFPGEHDWTHRDAPSGSTEKFDLQITTQAGRRAVFVPSLVLAEDEHFRLRVDDEGRVWMSRGGEGWLGTAEFGGETLLPTSR